MTNHTPRECRSIDTRRRHALSCRVAGKALLIIGIALVALPFGSATASTSSKQEIGFGASAYATQAVVANLLRSGPSAAAGIGGGGCTTEVGLRSSNSLAAVHLPHLVESGTLHSFAASKKTRTGVAATSFAETQGLSLLGGLIRATAVKAASTTNRNSKTGKFSVSGAGTKLVGLVIAGHHIRITTKPNTKIRLPGIGYVILNQEGGAISKVGAGLTVVGIHVVVNLQNRHAPIGSSILVSVASSSLSGPAKALLVGGAFGTAANIANTVIVGPSFPIGLGCLGTRGKKWTNEGAGVNLAHALTSGTIVDSAKGNATSHQVWGQTSSTIQHLNVLNGLVTAHVVKAAVNANGKPPKLGDTSSFLGLKVSGHPLIGDNVAPNTHFSVAGLGTLWLHRQVKTSTTIEVVMVQVVIGNPHNKLHLPVGAIVDVGVARVGVL